MAADLYFRLAGQNGLVSIEERKPEGRVWRWQVGDDGRITRDYAIVARLFDSNTGQLLIITAGLGADGTEAAGSLISQSQALRENLAHVPSGWQTKNLEMVISTDVIDHVAGPPRFVAVHVW